MKKENLKPFTLTGDQVQILFDNSECEPEDREEVDGYEGCTVDCDTDTGDYDGEKGAKIDFDVYLYDKDGNLLGEAQAGYYTGVTGVRFDESEITFYPPTPETPEDKFNDFLNDVASSNISLKNKIDKIKKHIATLEV